MSTREPAADSGAVFISYSRRDYYFAESLSFHLDAAGVTTWMDTRRLEPGGEWAGQYVRPSPGTTRSTGPVGHRCTNAGTFRSGCRAPAYLSQRRVSRRESPSISAGGTGLIPLPDDDPGTVTFRWYLRPNW